MRFWLSEYLKNRKFYVKINNDCSAKLPIESGVPQGEVLSPVLFSIYINDITKINEFPNHNITSLLFADDLFACTVDHCIRRLIIQMQRYLDSLVKQMEINHGS